MDHATLMTQATLLREKLHEDSDSPIDIIALAQNIDGLTLVYYPLGDNLSGMCIKGKKDNNLIAINSAMTLGRQRFSLAHELYHLYYDDSMISVCAKKLNIGSEIERKADLFASYLLLPQTSLLRMKDKLAKNTKYFSLDDVIRIEQLFGISHQAAVYRLANNNFIAKKEVDSYLDVHIKNKATLLGFSTDLYKPSPESTQYMTYGDYILTLEKIKNRISKGKYEELLMEAFRVDLVYGIEEGDVID